MPFKRDKPESDSETDPESDYEERSPPKRLKHNPQPLGRVKVYIVQAKLDANETAELFGLAEEHCAELCSRVEEADVVVTNVHMRRRLERHIDWGLAHEKAIVTPQWLRDSVTNGRVMDCGEYAALECLHAETDANCPNCNPPDSSSAIKLEKDVEVDTPCANEDCKCRKTQSPPPNEGSTGLKREETEGALPSPPMSPTTKQDAIATRTRSHTKLPSSSTAGQTTLESYLSSPRPKSGSKGKGREALTHTPCTKTSSLARSTFIPPHLLPPSPPDTTDYSKLDHNARYAVLRASPLVCINQSLVDAFALIKKSRELEGEERSALSYARAIAVLKAYPYKIKTKSQVAKLPFVGSKILGMIDEFLKTGSISESEKIKADERFQSLSAFSSVYGIGPNTARGLYARGLRTLEHLERYYEVWEDPQVAATSQRDAKTDDDVKDVKPVVIEEADVRGEGGTTLIRAALGYREDLAIKIPRDEVEEIGRLMAAELEEVEKGCVSIIVGGYRRGKPESNDVDIVFTHPDKEKEKGLCKKLVKRLIERGLVTHVIHQSSFREHNALRTHHWDSLEKALTVFVHPPGSSYARAHVDKHGHRLRRRIDLIFAQPEIYWTAVVGWTGSTVFERDLRLWAKNEKGYKFDSSGITRRRDSKMMYAQTEKEVFDIMGLPWIDPTLRNADA